MSTESRYARLAGLRKVAQRSTKITKVLAGRRELGVNFAGWPLGRRADWSVSQYDRLSATDFSFLAAEDRDAGSSAHIGALLIFDGPPPKVEKLFARLEERLSLLPRYRQRLVYPPVGFGRPVWVDAPDFSLDHHFRRVRLSDSSGEHELCELAGRMFSERLDRQKPLWEIWVIEGLANGGWALLNKTHHAMIDGVGLVDLLWILLDDAHLEPGSNAVNGAVSRAPRSWLPRAAPSPQSLVIRGAAGTLRAFARIALAAVGAMRQPHVSAPLVWKTIAGIGHVLGKGIHRADLAPFNVPVSPQRNIAFATMPLTRVRSVKTVLGGTVNDVVLATFTGALRNWLIRHGYPADLRLRVGVPVSLRKPSNRIWGNYLTMLFVDLPVSVDEPGSRLSEIISSTRLAKQSLQEAGISAGFALKGLAPRGLQGVAARMSMSPRFVNLLVSNVHGPEEPMHLLGRRLQELRPIAAASEGFGLNAFVGSYDQTVSFGLIAERDAVPDLDLLGELLLAELDALVAVSNRHKTEQSPLGLARRQ